MRSLKWLHLVTAAATTALAASPALAQPALVAPAPVLGGGAGALALFGLCYYRFVKRGSR